MTDFLQDSLRESIAFAKAQRCFYYQEIVLFLSIIQIKWSHFAR